MSLILRYLIGRKESGGTPLYKYPDLKLQQELKEVKEDLNLILNKWKFGDTPLNSAQEFLNNFEPWINRKIKEQEELKEFLSNHGLHNLGDIKSVNFSNEELTNFLNFHKVKSLTQLEEQWQNTEQDYLKRIEELKKTKTAKLSEADKEKLAEYDDLITERDEAIREKKTLEQQNLALNNRLNLKQQEVNNKDTALEKLKKEKNQLEVNQQKALRDKNSLITTLNQEQRKLKQEIEGLTKENLRLIKKIGGEEVLE